MVRVSGLDRESLAPHSLSDHEFLQIRLTPEDRERLLRIAAADHLDASTWARQVILRALEKRQPRQPMKR